MNTIAINRQPCDTWTVNFMGHAHEFTLPVVEVLSFWSRLAGWVKPVRLEFNTHGQLLDVEDSDGNKLDHLDIPKTHWLWLDMVVSKPFRKE